MPISLPAGLSLLPLISNFSLAPLPVAPRLFGSVTIPGRRLGVSLAVGLLFAAGSATAQDGVWNNSRTGNQSWASGTNWVGGNVAGGADATATFNAATSATISASLGTTDRTLGYLRVHGVTTSTNAISIGGTAQLLLRTDLPGTGPVIEVNATSEVGLTIGSGVVLAGTQGFEKTGTGWLSISGAENTLTGDIVLTGGGIRSIGVGAIDGSRLVINGEATGWRVDEGEHQSNLVMRGGDAFLSGVGPSSGTADSTLSGVISEEGATARNVSYFNSVSGANRIKRFIVSGDNTYTGNTTIGREAQSETIVRITHGNAFGAGEAEVTLVAGSNHDRNTLELSGGVTVSGKTLTLAGRGQEIRGSLQSLDGNNVWDGEVRLGSTENARIGVTAGRLTLAGEVSGATAGGLIKVGAGTLELSAANTHSTGTNVIQGTLLLSHAEAAGTGELALRNESVLHIDTGIVAQVAILNLVSGNARLAFSLNGSLDGTGLLVAGDQLGGGTYTVDILDGGGLGVGAYTLLTIAGASSATGFELGLLESPYTASLAWENRQLILNVVPEPQTWAMAGLGLALCFYRFQKGRRKPLAIRRDREDVSA